MVILRQSELVFCAKERIDTNLSIRTRLRQLTRSGQWRCNSCPDGEKLAQRTHLIWMVLVVSHRGMPIAHGAMTMQFFPRCREIIVSMHTASNLGLKYLRWAVLEKVLVYAMGRFAWRNWCRLQACNDDAIVAQYGRTRSAAAHVA